ncbi:MAG TPA: hypothetical protein VIB39_02945 [Candidatus Angelobacter sp.]|jgi:hypothetical protein
MNRKACLALVIAASAFAAAQTPAGKTTQDDSTLLVGDWRGDSICAVRPSACHDEKALYRVTKAGDSVNRYSIEGNKIVDGKPEYMGTLQCTYEPDQRTLTCSTPKLVLHLSTDGKGLKGTMHYPDGSVARNIALRHD